MSEAQKRRSMIVTGGNNGLGFQCARFIGSEDPDAMAVLACRDVTAGIVAKAELKKRGIAAAVLPLNTIARELGRRATLGRRTLIPA